MEKGYIQMLVAFAVVLVFFILVDLFLSSRLYTECYVSDAIALSYKMIDAVELTKLNAKLALNFSIGKTLETVNMKACAGSNTYDCSSLSENYCTGCCQWNQATGKCQRKLCREIEQSFGCDKCGCDSDGKLKQDCTLSITEDSVNMTIPSGAVFVSNTEIRVKTETSFLMKVTKPDYTQISKFDTTCDPETSKSLYSDKLDDGINFQDRYWATE